MKQKQHYVQRNKALQWTEAAMWGVPLIIPTRFLTFLLFAVSVFYHIVFKIIYFIIYLCPHHLRQECALIETKDIQGYIIPYLVVY